EDRAERRRVRRWISSWLQRVSLHRPEVSATIRHRTRPIDHADAAQRFIDAATSTSWRCGAAWSTMSKISIGKVVPGGILAGVVMSGLDYAINNFVLAGDWRNV